MAEHIQPKGREKCGLQTQQGLDADVVPSPCRGMNMVKVMLSLLLTVETIAVVALDDDHAVALNDLTGGGEAVAGATVVEMPVEAVILMSIEALAPPSCEVAVMVASPTPLSMTSPPLTVATSALSVVHTRRRSVTLEGLSSGRSAKTLWSMLADCSLAPKSIDEMATGCC